MTTWILVADACAARLFLTLNNCKSLHLIKRFSHTQSRAREAELVTDRAGSGRSSGHWAPFSKQPHIAHKELEAIEFARDLNDFLRDAVEHKKFQSLVLVAPPHFLGLLRAELSPAVARAISGVIGKDLLYMDKARIWEHLIAVWPVMES